MIILSCVYPPSLRSCLVRLIICRSLIFVTMLIGIAEAEPASLVSTPWLDQTGEVVFLVGVVMSGRQVRMVVSYRD